MSRLRTRRKNKRKRTYVAMTTDSQTLGEISTTETRLAGAHSVKEADRPLGAADEGAGDAAKEAELAARLQRELADKLRSPHFQPLVDVMLERTGALLQTVLRFPVPFWISALALAAAILLPSLLISLALGEFSSEFGIERVPSEFALVGLVFVGTVVLKMELDEVYTVCGRHVIHHIESVRDLQDLHRWFVWISRRWTLLVPAVAGGVVTGLLAISYASTVRGEFLGFGPAVLDIAVNILALIGIYYIICFVNLAHRLGGYHYQMFSLDPHKSEVIHHLAAMLFSYVRSIALFMGAVTLVLGRFAVIDASVIGVLLVAGWAPIAVAFFLSESTLARIIGNTKWRILEEVQHELEQLRSTRPLSDAAYLEECDRLLAFHDRIWATPNHALDMTAVLSFINTLLLPLVSFAITQVPSMLPWTTP